MAYIHLSTDPVNKRGCILLSDSKEFNPTSGYPCYEIISTKEYPSADNISWYIHESYKGFTWTFDSNISTQNTPAMYYKFRVETLQLTNNTPWHTIAKKASSSEEAMQEIIRDAIARGLSIERIEFCGQYWEEPSCKTTFRKHLK